jgi:hypothetical protein
VQRLNMTDHDICDGSCSDTSGTKLHPLVVAEQACPHVACTEHGSSASYGCDQGDEQRQHSGQLCLVDMASTCGWQAVSCSTYLQVTEGCGSDTCLS